MDRGGPYLVGVVVRIGVAVQFSGVGWGYMGGPGRDRRDPVHPVHPVHAKSRPFDIARLVVVAEFRVAASRITQLGVDRPRASCRELVLYNRALV